ncbi:MAG TPA: glycoside hydrolase family 3 N-terminal domain-containing protein [Ktedonobacteraceae bacterium]|nr:glycoside hydrolase family 3 N-terminal domain-containing protein [Ktedonobacteraceae bacterium]
MWTRQSSRFYQFVQNGGRGKIIASGKLRRSGLLGIFSIFLLFLTACVNPIESQVIAAPPTRTAITISATPEPTPTPDALQAVKARAAQLLAGMSLEQKLGQLIVVEYLGNNYKNSGLQYMVQQQYVGGVLYQYVNHNFDDPYNTVDAMAGFSRQIQSDAKIPLLIGTDQEGGQVNRLWTFHGDLPSAEAMAATGDSQYVYNQGEQAAKWMLELGINSDLAPVVDVHTVDPAILQDRMFGKTPEAVSTYAGAFLDGLQQNGVAGTLKHFPGLGAVTSDPHYGLPTINRSMSQLESIDLAPYKTMISKNSPAMIMDTDVLMPAIDPNLPAELSPKAIDGLLRKELGYDGVVITDGLYMHGISERWTLSQASVLAIIAGNDLIEGPYTVAQVGSVVTALKQAMQDGKLTMARLDQSVTRILTMKLEYKMLT